jgi:hypothetical protein
VPGYVSAIRRHYIVRSNSGAPSGRRLAIRASTCGPASMFPGGDKIRTLDCGDRAFLGLGQPARL